MARSQWMDAGASQASASQARRGAVVALSFSLAMAFGLAACTTSKPSPTPSVSSSPSPSVSVRPTPSSSPTWLPVIPESLLSPGLDGALAGAMFFLTLYPYAQQTLDLEAWTALSGPDCRFCASVVTRVHELASIGSHLEGGAVTFDVRKTRVEQLNEGRALVTLVASQAATDRVAADGTRSRSSTGGTDTMTLLMTRERDTWLVAGVNVGSSST